MQVNRCYFGDCRDLLKAFVAAGVRSRTCVTSPPYFGLRDYGHENQVGLESSPDEYVEEMVSIFRLVRDCLIDDGTLWLNIGDSYAASGRGGGGGSFQDRDIGTKISKKNNRRKPINRFKQKDLIGIPWMLAFALREDGWYLRQDIIWHKPNPMPESVRDRCTKSHEYIFLLSKSRKYYFDAEAIAEPALWPDGANNMENCKYVTAASGDPKMRTKANLAKIGPRDTRNKRSVWTVPTTPFGGAHFAVFPKALIEPCILAGSKPGDVVLDPFMGSGTTAQVAEHLNRNWLGCELNADYKPLQEKRLEQMALPIHADPECR